MDVRGLRTGVALTGGVADAEDRLLVLLFFNSLKIGRGEMPR
jgi:hypothetical protein